MTRQCWGRRLEARLREQAADSNTAVAVAAVVAAAVAATAATAAVAVAASAVAGAESGDFRRAGGVTRAGPALCHTKAL